MRASVRPVAMIVLAAGLGAAAACGGSEAAAKSGGDKLVVVATTPQVRDFVQNIGGDRVAVTGLIKPGADPHDYEPTARDLRTIGEAKVLVLSGAGLEKKWVDSAVSSSGFSGKCIDSSAGITLLTHVEDGRTEDDPHIWHSVPNAERMATNIEAGLAAADKKDAAMFKQNLDGYEGKLRTLDARIRKEIGTLPAGHRKFVTNHDAFGYYVHTYGLDFVGSIIPSFDTNAEVSGKQLNDLVRKIKQTGTKAVFSESSIPPKTAEALGQEAGVKVLSGDQALYGDSLAVSGPGSTYIGAEEHNLRTIVDNLR
ncbi:MAG TPA: metal ABC transporter substrate-binding protein [Mycobacteriales bacterium]|nr:metal ABC transporter substrate-binding protein [Mycobacteriales bacterium]